MIKKIKSNCKINIGLNVEGVLENGYHLLDMVMVPLELSDNLTIDFKGVKGDIIIKTNKPEIPVDERNILAKIYKKFFEKSGLPPEEIEIYLEKIIPVEGGLGGGSSNGAFFLKELNSYYGDYFSLEELISLGKEVGADIPFFLLNKSSRVRGIGEEIEVFQNSLNTDIILLKPDFGVSTPEAFKNFDILPENLKGKKAKISEIIRGISENKLYNVKEGIVNQLEIGLLENNEKIKEAREHLKQVKEMEFYMSGSGSVYFTFVNEDNVLESLSKLKDHLKGWEIYNTKFLK